MREWKKPRVWEWGLFGVAVVVVCVVGMRAQRWFPPAVDQEELAKFIRYELGHYGVRLPAGARVLAGENRSGRDLEVWGKIRMSPADFSGIREELQAVVKGSEKAWRVEELPMGKGPKELEFTPPAWWRPGEGTSGIHMECADTSGCVFVFSESQSCVYVLMFDR